MVQSTTPQITWHGGEDGKNDPILSCDIHPLELDLCAHDDDDGAGSSRMQQSQTSAQRASPTGKKRARQALLATGGQDSDVRLWALPSPPPDQPGSGVEEGEEDKEKAKHASRPVFLGQLTRHQGAVNVVRFSPDGTTLASAGDGGALILWKVARAQDWSEVREARDVETILLSPSGGADIYDICWSPCGEYMATGSVDNHVNLWKAGNRKKMAELKDHTNYVQGVAWDPRGECLATQSTDRTVRLYALQDRCKTCHLSSIKNLKGGEPLFFSEAAQTYVRRLAWSPDGALLICPTGHNKAQGLQDCSHVFLRGEFGQPAVSLPGNGCASVAVRFCDSAFSKIEGAKGAWTDLPYRMLFAVATMDSVAVYDTSQKAPLFLARGYHFAPLTDVAWIPGGKGLVMVSTDGYATIIRFEDGELGAPLPKLEQPWVQKGTKTKEAPKEKDVEVVRPAQQLPEQAPAGTAVAGVVPGKKKIAPILLSTQPAPAAGVAPKKIAPTLVSSMPLSGAVSVGGTGSSSSAGAPAASKTKKRVTPTLVTQG